MTDTEKLNELRVRILRASHASKEGHIASAFSVLDIIYALYKYGLWYSPLEPNHPDRDYFILSKGHGAMALYAVLSEMKFFDPRILDTYCQKDSILGGHPDRYKVPGVEVSSGSLGHGLPMAVGLAMALKHEGAANKVFCLIGDGELNEGSCWEALMTAGVNNLDNLYVIIDYNHSTDAALDLDPLHTKLDGLRLELRSAAGHNVADIVKWLQPKLAYRDFNSHPKVVIAHTFKGFGVRAIEENPQAWHHRSPTDEELAKFLEELA